MAELPSGTVTFLFTDIEGSTRLLHELGEQAYTEVVAAHRLVLRDAFARRGGVEVDTQGDAFFVAFARASDALAAAGDAQAALTGPIRVRIGVHTGEPLVTDEGYVGLDVHRAARIAAAGHGGQVLVSHATRELVGPQGLRDLREHRLKDLTAPERIYQLGDGDFPPLKSLNQTNLPVQVTPLIGRRMELRDVVEFTSSSRLLTLTGPGGSGKTRLALQAAAEVVDDFPDGVWFVPLAALTDATLLLPTIASTLGLQEEVPHGLGSKELLLVLDNLEQLLPDAARAVATLLSASQVRILVTSRERLAISGEQDYEVLPLPLDDAVDLFTTRARQLKTSFEPDRYVAQIARRLDGLPLALELAAARTRLMTTQQIAERLAHSLDILSTGTRDAPDRQRTLRATIEWSYHLLSEAEQGLLARLSVFAGSFELDAAGAICGSNVDELQSLVEKSLLRRTEVGRLFMLATIREFASEKLGNADRPREELGQGEAREALLQRHSVYYLGEARRLYADGGEAGSTATRNTFRVEQDNFRATLEFLLRAGPPEDVLEMVEDLGSYWLFSGQLEEGQRWVERALKVADPTPRRRLVWVTGLLGEFLRFRGDFEAAIPVKEQTLEMARALGNVSFEAATLHDLAEAFAQSGDYIRARDLALQALDIRRQQATPTGIAHALSTLFDIELFDGNYDEAEKIGDEVLRLESQHASDGVGHALAMFALAECRRRQQHHAEAAALLREALLRAERLDLRMNLVDMLYSAAALTWPNAPRKAAMLVGSAEALAHTTGFHLWDKAEWSRVRAVIRCSLEDSAFEAASAEGSTLSGEAALRAALDSLDSEPSSIYQPSTRTGRNQAD